jgi:hypothetical protein
VIALRLDALGAAAARAFALSRRTVLRSPGGATAMPHRPLRNLALQDYAMLGLHGTLATEALLRVTGGISNHVIAHTLELFAATLLCVALTRGEVLPRGPLRSLVYRFGMFGTMVGSYFELRPLLPALSELRLDRVLVGLDQTMFGETPSLWLDRFVTPARVEWFAFFYYSYFWLLGLYLVGALLFDQGRRRYELLLAAALRAAHRRLRLALGRSARAV